MKSIYLFLIVWTFWGPLNRVHSEVLMLPEPSTSEAEFEHVATSLSGKIDYPDFHQKFFPRLENVSKLNQLFANAQASFISTEDIEEVKRRFELVLQLEFEDDWKESQRKIILMSYLRLLQLSESQEQKDKKQSQWLENAAFYLDFLKAPKEFIPPSILDQVENFKKSQSLQAVEANKNQMPLVTTILIQGMPFSPKIPLLTKTPNKKVRATFLSRHHQPETKIIPISEIAHQKSLSKPFVVGHCQESKINEGIQLGMDHEIYLSESCDTAKDSKEIQLSSISVPQSTFKPNYRKWAWIGAGLVATAIVIHQMDNKRSEPPPSRTPSDTHGF